MVKPSATGRWFCCIGGLPFTGVVEGDWPCCDPCAGSSVPDTVVVTVSPVEDFFAVLADEGEVEGAGTGTIGDVFPVAEAAELVLLCSLGWEFDFCGIDVIRQKLLSIPTLRWRKYEYSDVEGGGDGVGVCVW